MTATISPRVIPELDVSNLEGSLRFYTDGLGFQILYERPEDGFACLDLEGARLMLEAASGPGRHFRTAPLERPFGRGVNLQIQVGDAASLHTRLCKAGHTPLIPLETRWYRTGAVERGHLQFVAVDPDGYLLRFFSDLGTQE